MPQNDNWPPRPLLPRSLTHPSSPTLVWSPPISPSPRPPPCKKGSVVGSCCSHCSLAPPPTPPTPPSRLCPPARPPAHPSAQIQKHPCLPFLGGYSQHSVPQWVEPVHPSLLPHCPQIFPRNMPASRKSSGTGKKHSLPEAPPVPSDVAAPFSWGSAARRQPLNNNNSK